MTAFPANFMVPFLVSTKLENLLKADSCWLPFGGVAPFVGVSGLEAGNPPGNPPGSFIFLRALSPSFAFGTTGAEEKLWATGRRFAGNCRLPGRPPMGPPGVGMWGFEPVDIEAPI